MAVLFLTEADVAQLVDTRVAVEVVEVAFRRMAAGEVANVPRARSQAPAFVLHSMSATAAYLGLAGWKNYTTTRQGARFHVGLYEISTGRLVAILEANRLGQL